MLPAIFGLVFLWIKSDVTLIAPWPMLMLFIFFANLLIVAAGWKYLGVTRSDRQAQAILMFLAVFEPLLTYKVLIAEGTNLTPWVQIACYCAGQAAVWVTIVWGQRYPAILCSDVGIKRCYPEKGNFRLAKNSWKSGSGTGRRDTKNSIS